MANLAINHINRDLTADQHMSGPNALMFAGSKTGRPPSGEWDDLDALIGSPTTSSLVNVKMGSGRIMLMGVCH